MLIFVSWLFLVQLFAEKKHSISVYFDTNKYLLHKKDYLYINNVIDSLSKFNIRGVEIVGHTDNSADSLYNIKLSNRRANEVRKYILTFGFNENVVIIGFYGENKPIAKNDNEADKRKNRRAEIIITYGDKAVVLKPDSCILKDTVIRTRGGKELVFNGCEFEEIKNCLEIIEQNNSNEFKKGIFVLNKKTPDLLTYGMLQVNLLDGCVKNECFKNPVLVRFPVKKQPEGELSWALYKGEKKTMKLVKVKDKLFYELELICPTSWINCNCKKNQKH